MCVCIYISFLWVLAHMFMCGLEMKSFFFDCINATHQFLSPCVYIFSIFLYPVSVHFMVTIALYFSHVISTRRIQTQISPKVFTFYVNLICNTLISFGANIFFSFSDINMKWMTRLPTFIYQRKRLPKRKTHTNKLCKIRIHPQTPSTKPLLLPLSTAFGKCIAVHPIKGAIFNKDLKLGFFLIEIWQWINYLEEKE